jgi:hypothetical protein
MRMKTGLAILLVSLVGTFAGINWHLLATPAHVNFLVAFKEIPIGLVLAGVTLLLGFAFAVYWGLWQRRVINDYRRQSQDLRAQRRLADDAESSRFTALSNLMKEELTRVEKNLAQAIENLRCEVHATENSISATLAELDDRIARTGESPSVSREVDRQVAESKRDPHSARELV